MAARKSVPQAGNLIRVTTLTSGAVVGVEWSDKLNIESATYCKIKARWGVDAAELEATHQGTAALTHITAADKAEVDIFIATEYYASAFKNQNPEHILNFKSLKNDTITEKLDSRFFYGQSFGGGSRFIVYHPPLREPFQGRFKKSSLVVAFASMADLLPDLEALTVKIKLQPKKFAMAISGLLLLKLGHRLHRFSDDPTQPDVTVLDVGEEKEANEYNVNADPRFLANLPEEEELELPPIPDERANINDVKAMKIMLGRMSKNR